MINAGHNNTDAQFQRGDLYLQEDALLCVGTSTYVTSSCAPLRGYICVRQTPERTPHIVRSHLRLDRRLHEGGGAEGAGADLGRLSKKRGH